MSPPYPHQTAPAACRCPNVALPYQTGPLGSPGGLMVYVVLLVGAALIVALFVELVVTVERVDHTRGTHR